MLEKIELAANIARILLLAGAGWSFWRAGGFLRRANRRSSLASGEHITLGLLCAAGLIWLYCHCWSGLNAGAEPRAFHASAALRLFLVAVDLARVGVAALCVRLVIWAEKAIALDDKFHKTMTAVVLLVAGVLGLLLTSVSGIYSMRNTVALPACSAGFGLLNYCAWKYARDHGLPDGTVFSARDIEDMTSIAMGTAQLRCPSGGVCTVTKAGELPSCSFHRDIHRIPTKKNLELVLGMPGRLAFWWKPIAREFVHWKKPPWQSTRWLLWEE